MFYAIISIISIIAGSAAMSGGGGGGGSSSGSAVVTPDPIFPPEPTWISTFDTSVRDGYKNSDEYQKNVAGFEKIGLADSYALLDANSKAQAGEGITIGITGLGMKTTHAEIASNLSTDPTISHYVNSAGGSTLKPGSAVTSVVAGVKNGGGMHGIAFNSKIISAAVHTATGNWAYKINDSGNPTGQYGLGYTINHGAKVFMASWTDFAIPHTNTEAGIIGNDAFFDYNPALIAGALGPVLLNEGISNSAGSVVIFSTGEDANLNYVRAPAVVVAIPAISSNVGIAVAGYDLTNSTIMASSNRCKQVKSFCMVAPGNVAQVAIPDGGIALDIATDPGLLASSYVAGAAAILRAAWPQLTAAQTVNILLNSATDLRADGVAIDGSNPGDGVDDVYGNGLLNLYAAVQARGQHLLPASSSVSSAGFDVGNSSIIGSPVFGDALSYNLDPVVSQAVFFDDYGRDYKANLNQKISNSSSGAFSLDSTMFSSYSTTELPLRFGEGGEVRGELKISFLANNLNFNGDGFSPSFSQNIFGIKHLTYDRSKYDPQLIGNSNISTSYTHKIDQDFKLGFQSNYYKSYDEESFTKQFNFLSGGNQHSFESLENRRSSSFAASDTTTNKKLFFSQKLGENFSTSFSYSNSGNGTSPIKFTNADNRMFESGLKYDLNKKTQFGATYGDLKEYNNYFLGAQSTGAFSGGSNPKTKFFKINSRQKIRDNLYFTSSYSEGKTDLAGNDVGIFREFKDVRSRGFSSALLADTKFGLIGVSYTEPLRVYSGSARVNIPTGYADGGVTRLEQNVSLKPKGREKDFELFFSKALDESSSLSLNAILQQERGNIKNNKDAHLLVAKYRLNF